MEESSEVVPAPSDPRARDHREKPNFNFGERDFVDHRQVYVGIHMPMHGADDSHSSYRRGNGREGNGKVRATKHYAYRKKRSGQTLPKHSEESLSEGEDFIAPASERVKFILGTCDEGDEAKHELFTELEEFVVYEDGHEEWKETARWYKYEEDVEEGGDRWSKPHVATLSLYSLFELRSNLMSGTVILDMEADDLSQIADRVLDNLISCNKLEENARMRVRDTILKRHRHQRSGGIKKGLSSMIGRRTSAATNLGVGGQVKRLNSLNSSNSIYKMADGNASVSSGLHKKPLTVTTSAGLQSQMSTTSASIPQSASFVRSESVHGHLVYQGQLPTIPSEENDKLSGFMKKLPPNAEASNVLVGEVDFLGKSITAFVRLQKGATLGDLTEVPIPTRFLFIMLGPICSHPGQYHEIGRAISTLLADEVFHDVAYKAKSRDDLIAGIDEFLEQVTVLPPGEWDPSIRIDPPPQTFCKEFRRPALDHRKTDTLSVPTGKPSSGSDSGVSLDGDGQKFWERTKRPFGGLRNDVTNWRHRGHDIRDAFHLQSAGTVLFLYFVLLALVVTLGDHQSRSTDGAMDYREHLLALLFGGGIFALFSGQPLILIGLALPVVKFEELLFRVSEISRLDYLPLRLWVGVFSALMIIVLVGVDSSVFARYFTRFAQETFTAVVAINLVYVGFACLNSISFDYPIHHGYVGPHSCGCYQHSRSNATPVVNSSAFVAGGISTTSNVTLQMVWERLDVPFRDCLTKGGVLRGDACSDNVLFFSVILMAMTVGVACLLASFRSTGYFPKLVRQLFGDFASLIAVVSASLLAHAYDINIPFVALPATYHPYESGRDSWLVPALGSNPGWVVVVALVAAFPLTMLFYVEYHLTALLINGKENLLKKSFGYHQDFIVMALVVIVCSVLGLPFVTTSCILSINHVQGLRIDDLRSGRAHFSAVREQKLTALLLCTLIGVSPLMMPALKHIPVPVLYGILVYAAIRIFNGSQLLERVKVMLMPAKHQPDRIYLRQMPAITVHIFSIIQLVCIVILLPIRSSLAAVVFPFIVMLLVVIRALLELLLPQPFLVTLDDVIIKAFWRHRLLPSTQEEALLHSDTENKDGGMVMIEMGTAANEGEESIHNSNNGGVATPIGLTNGTAPVNISEELLKTAVWKQLVKDDSHGSTPRDSPTSGSPSNHRKRRRKYQRGNSNSSRSCKKDTVPTIIKTDIMRKEESPPPLPPWCEPYLSPPRADTKYLSICGNEVSIDPACSRSGSKTPSMDEEGSAAEDASLSVLN